MGLKIALVGYGRMGREIECVIKERGHTLVARFDTYPQEGVDTQLSAAKLSGIDGVIEFSLPAGITTNAAIYAEAKVQAVIGTTGWESQRTAVKTIVDKAGIGYIYGSNYSVGANLFFRLAAKAAALINQQPDYDIMVHEYHHNKKADSPSGTALTAAEHIIDKLDRKTLIQTQTLSDRPIRPEELHVSSGRIGSVPGIHTVFLDSLADSIEITHTARGRRGFALGSVLALEWLQGKTGFMEVSDFMNDVLGA
jgi:4-hydroxy-tetrahydrodipicolinate reductase